MNNAGFNVMGDVEWLTVPLYHKAMNVNFYGTVRVTRTFLYLVRKARGWFRNFPVALCNINKTQRAGKVFGTHA